MTYRNFVFFMGIVLVGCTSLPPDRELRACDDGRCVVVPSECCQDCGVTTLDQVTAIHPSFVDAYAASLGCDGTACAACAPLRNPNLQARCELASDLQWQCVAFDIRTDPAWAGCTVDEDCYPRTADCCTCNADVSYGNLIAVGPAFPNDGARWCPELCGGCDTRPPADASARCVDGHCELVLP